MVILARCPLMDRCHHDSYHDGMNRTTISLPHELHKKVRRLAFEEGVSMAEFIREAVEEKAERKRRPRPHLGIFDSGHTDTSVLAGEVRPEPRSWR